MARPDEAVRPPQQRRSLQSLDRILHATERLLQDRPFEQLSIQTIVRASRTSIGAFYNRFRNKTALLAGLYERYDSGFAAWIEQWRGMQGDPPADLVRTAAWVTRFLIDTFHTRRHLLRALALYVRSHPAEQRAETKARRATQLQFLVDALLSHRNRFRHTEPERAARAAVFGATAICRERILFPDAAHAESTEQTESQLLQDVTRMQLGLLRPDPRIDFSRI